jgi:hypothetical protein
MSAQGSLNIANSNRVSNVFRRFHLLKISLLLGTIIATCMSSLSQTATTTSLTLISGGNSVTSIIAGAMITLTASVSAGSTVLRQGQVNFCDATATYCTDIHLLGTAQLTSSGRAQLHLRPARGNYSYKAVFLGTPRTKVPFAPSTSDTANLKVNGKVATATIISQSGASDDYSLTAALLAFAKSQTLAAPSGTVSFLDTTTSNSVMGTATLNPVSGPAWVNSSNPAVGNTPSGVVTGDFNRDGNLDLAIGINTVAGSSVSLLLGDGDGNFTPAPGDSLIPGGVPLAVADFNQDGIPDLLLSNGFSGSLTVVLGNGDGSFSQAAGSPLISNYGVNPVAVADFNGDGIPDIAAGGAYYLIIWLGNGDGTFAELPLSNSLVEPNVNGMVVGDFNGDGIPDLAGGGETVSVYFGNGDGIFTPGPTTVVTTVHSGIPANLTTGDFNGDGKLDIALPIPFSGVIAVFLGNGDGTFQPATNNPTVGLWANRIATGDFNGDGIPDLYLNAETSLTNVFVLLGNGDGTFSVVSNGPPQQPCCWTTAVVDLNGDGVSDIASVDFYNNAVAVFLTGTKQFTAAITGISVTGESPQQVIARYPGDTDYLSSESAPTSLLVQADAPVFTPASGGIIAVGQTITIMSSTPEVSIYYQATGAIQTNGYVDYFLPIPVFGTGTLTIQAYASSYNYGQSAVSNATYTVILSDPVPIITSMSPPLAMAGGQGFALTVEGSGFVSSSTVYLGTTALTTQFVSSDQLTAQMTTSAIANAGVRAVTVQNPAPGGGTSNSLQFELDSGSATPPVFTTTSATVTAGSAASYPVTLASSATGITVQCLNLPSDASCSYSTSSGALSIATSSSTPAGTYQVTAVFTETLPGSSMLASAALFFLPFAFVAIGPKKLRQSILTIALLVGALVAIGCGGGGGGGGTQPQNHQVTSSGVVMLTVQ